MKELIRQALLNTFSLYLVASFYPGLIVPPALLQLLWAGAIFTLINLLVKPIVRLFLLPINLMTLGLFGWLANVLILLIATRLLDSLAIISFTTAAFSSAGFSVPEIFFSRFLSLISASFLLSFTYRLLDSLLVQD